VTPAEPAARAPGAAEPGAAEFRAAARSTPPPTRIGPRVFEWGLERL